MRKIGAHAVVVGASMGGLLAARVLADAYQKVTVTDRDSLLPEGQSRRGVPQGRHYHALLPSGAGILEQLFPGLIADLVSGGTPVVSDFSQARVSFGGHPMCDQAAPMPGGLVQASRPYLEWQVRTRVQALPNVEIISQCQAAGLVACDAGDRVTGVGILRRADGTGDGGAETMRADLVVDAAGRTGRTAAWLSALGYAQPAEERVTVDIKYVSRPLRLRPGALGDKKLVAISARPAPTAGTTPATAHTTAHAARSPRPAATHRREDAARRRKCASSPVASAAQAPAPGAELQPRSPRRAFPGRNDVGHGLRARPNRQC